MKIVAFAASSSRNSINKQLVTYAASLLNNVDAGAEVEILDINDFEMPLFSEDREQELGQPDAAQRFFNKIGAADALLISFAEHNGSYTAAYKNLYDWTSRIDPQVYQGKPMVLLATSPGPGGASSVLATAKNSAPFGGGDVKADLSLASFYDIFDTETQQLTDADAQARLAAALSVLV
jgi:NAD(P)H-dependent FMN reductase